MNKGIQYCACAAVLAVFACGSFAGAAQPSAGKLSQMGLSGAKIVSDSVAMEVRGAAVFAASRASAKTSGILAVSKSEATQVAIQAGDTSIGIATAKATTASLIPLQKTTVYSRGFGVAGPY